REFVAESLADFHVRFADKIIGGREPAGVGHGLQVPDDDACLHICRVTKWPTSGKRTVSGLAYLCSPTLLYQVTHMADIKLFNIAHNQVNPIQGASETIEKSVQLLFEKNLEALLGVRFLASEFKTTHGGRIDTLGLDENGSPVILEYKRATNENVINQGLFYLDWLMDHKKDFQWLVLEKLGKEGADDVDWSAPRLICIAGDFTRYDDHAVKQIQRNIELIRYRRFGSDLLMLDLASATTVTGDVSDTKPTRSSESGGIVNKYKTISTVR